MIRFLLAVWLAAISLAAQPAPPPACPLTPAQVGSALGAAVDSAKPGLSMSIGIGTLQDCRYAVKSGKSSFTLMLKTTTYNKSITPAQHFESLAGRLTPVPNDPDGARLQENQGDLSSPTVHYYRKGTGVELRLLGVYYQDLKPTPAEFASWQRKLLALPRIP